MYETDDVPYTLYTVFGTRKRWGMPLGRTNEGPTAIFRSLRAWIGPENSERFIFRKIRSPKAEGFRDPAFLAQLAAIPLEEYPRLLECAEAKRCRDARLPEDPSGGEEREDYIALLRGMAKLNHLRTLLLQPGVYPSNTKGRSRMEHSSLLWLPEQEYRPLSRPKREPILSVIRSQNATERVAVVEGLGDTVVYPISLLTLHPVIEDQVGNTPVAVTWSSISETLTHRSSTRSREALNSRIPVISCLDCRSSWIGPVGRNGFPKEVPLSTEGEEESHVLFSSTLMEFGEAALAFPHAHVAVSEDPYERHKTVYQQHKERFHSHSGKGRAILLSDSNRHVVVSATAFPTEGLYSVQAGPLSAWIVRYGSALAAFRIRGYSSGIPEGGASTSLVGFHS